MLVRRSSFMRVGKPRKYSFQPQQHPRLSLPQGFLSQNCQPRLTRKEKSLVVGWIEDDACILVIYLRSDGVLLVFARSRVVRAAGRWRMRLAAGGGALDDFAVLDVVGVVGLDVDGEAVEGALEGLLGGGVHHAGLHG